MVAVLAQRISVDGYAENSTQSTALGFLPQDVDSLIGSAGWQASFALNDHIKPYVRMTWDREFEDAAAQAWGRSQSVAGSLPYAVPGVTYDVVLELARSHGMKHEVREVLEAEVRSADELWMTSSTKEVLPITSLDGRPVGDGKPGPMGRQMYAWYQDFKNTVMRNG